MRTVLREVVALGGLALQSEDCAIRAAVHHRGEQGGLAHIANERHHQFIVWRAILPMWRAELERYGNTDLTIDCEGERHYFEMKNWTGVSGERQLPMIQSDIYKLQPWQYRYIIITSLNPAGDTNENLKFLLGRVVGLFDEERQDFRFQTKGRKGESLEFWIAGWPVLAVERPSSL